MKIIKGRYVIRRRKLKRKEKAKSITLSTNVSQAQEMLVQTIRSMKSKCVHTVLATGKDCHTVIVSEWA
jgi:hypothetical protein